MYEDLYLNIDDPDAYLARLCMGSAEFKPDREHLDRLLWSHHRYVPFDNLDVWAGAQEPALGIPALFDKIVKNRRGGYCFEMNGLLEAALRTLGYECYSVEVKIVKGRNYLPPARHRAVIAILDGRKLFCDVGLGFQFFPASSELNAGFNEYGIRADCRDGIIEVWSENGNGGERLLYIQDRPADPVDFINPNFCCSMDPVSGFRTRLSMVIMTEEGYRKNLVCSSPAPVHGERYSPQFTVTVKDKNLMLSEKTFCGAEALEEILLKDFGVEYRFK